MNKTLSPALFANTEGINVINNTPFLMTQIDRTAAPVISAFPQDPFSVIILSSPPHADEDPLMPWFHADRDNPLVCHTTLKGGGLEFPTGPLSAYEEAVLGTLSPFFSIETLNKQPGWEGRFHTAEPGDMIVFGPRFFHRTTSKFEENGQLAVSVSVNAPASSVVCI